MNNVGVEIGGNDINIKKKWLTCKLKICFKKQFLIRDKNWPKNCSYNQIYFLLLGTIYSPMKKNESHTLLI